MSKTGWDCKNAAAVLGISPTKFSQAVAPAMHKIALLMLADPLKTLISLSNVMEAMAQEQERAAHPTNRIANLDVTSPARP